MSDAKAEANREQANELLDDMVGGLTKLLTEKKVDQATIDESTRWIKQRLAELALVIIQQKNGILEMAVTMDEVFIKLRQWSEGRKKAGWKTAKKILDEVLLGWRKRHGGDRQKEPNRPLSPQDIIDSAHPPSLKADV